VKKERAITAKVGLKGDYEKQKQMYANVISPYSSQVEKGFIKCPECGEEILITSTLMKMNEIIENHVQLHRDELESNLLLKYTKPINIRLALAKQTLQQI
jgi:transcription initiation factor IIE alpha subunit